MESFEPDDLPAACSVSGVSLAAVLTLMYLHSAGEPELDEIEITIRKTGRAARTARITRRQVIQTNAGRVAMLRAAELGLDPATPTAPPRPAPAPPAASVPDRPECQANHDAPPAPALLAALAHPAATRADTRAHRPADDPWRPRPIR